MIESNTKPLSQNETANRRRVHALWITTLALIIVLVLWNVPVFAPILYPFRLFVTYAHEAGHSLMALLTGGQVLQFTVSPDGSGIATTAGGSRALILPAGYIGAAFFGSILFYLTNRFSATRLISISLGILLIIFSVLFARPDQNGAITALIVGNFFGFVLVLLGWKASRWVNLLALNMLSILTGLNAVFDLLGLIRSADRVITGTNGMIRNDAAAFAAEFTPIIPASFWAIVWAFIAFIILLTSIYLSIIRPLRRNSDSDEKSLLSEFLES